MKWKSYRRNFLILYVFIRLKKKYAKNNSIVDKTTTTTKKKTYWRQLKIIVKIIRQRTTILSSE